LAYHEQNPTDKSVWGNGKYDLKSSCAIKPLVTANKIPSPIFVTAITGLAQKLYIVPPANLSQFAWPTWIAKHVPEKVLAFGKVEDFVINYTPDHPIRSDLLEYLVNTLVAAYRRGSAQMNDILDLPKVNR
jgi:hypothetical protein